MILDAEEGKVLEVYKLQNEQFYLYFFLLFLSLFRRSAGATLLCKLPYKTLYRNNIVFLVVLCILHLFAQESICIPFQDDLVNMSFVFLNLILSHEYRTVSDGVLS